MNRLVSFFLLLCTSVFSARAAAPDRLAGLVYYESGFTIARSAYASVRTFSSDGSYTELFSRSTGATLQGEARPLPPVNGTYVYRKLDDSTAELILTAEGTAPETALQTRTLRFTSENEGTVELLSTGSANFRVAALTNRSPLVNCSNRSQVDGTGPAFTGFVLTGETSRLVMIRAVGPSLAPFGVSDYLKNPTLSVVRASTLAVVGNNDDWSSDNAESLRRIAAAVGAFPLLPNSKDAAVALLLPPGAYIAQTQPAAANDSGQALIEVYLLP